MATPKMNLGKFFHDQDGLIHGTISGLGMVSTTVMSQVVTDREGKHYQKLIGDPLGAAYEIGAAFPKEKDGMPYYSVTLDSPIFPTPIHAAFFYDRDNASILNLVWTRKEIEKPSTDIAHTAGQPAHRRYVAGATP